MVEMTALIQYRHREQGKAFCEEEEIREVDDARLDRLTTRGAKKGRYSPARRTSAEVVRIPVVLKSSVGMNLNVPSRPFSTWAVLPKDAAVTSTSAKGLSS